MSLLRRLVPLQRGVSGRRATSKLSLNPVQAASLNETCLLVDTGDNVVGTASKRKCHQVGPGGEIPLHRAFSVFIFNSRQELLLQKRSATKITYPNHVTNSCCSHPLHNFVDERDEVNGRGIKVAARRRLEHELGIPQSLVHLDDIVYLTRVLYKDTGDGVWGEHEVDYILFIIGKELPLRPNPEEVSELSYLQRDQLSTYLATLRDPATPWFSLIAHSHLTTWWDNLHRINKYQNHETILNFTN